ncbi:MAG: hypothetical protein PHH00_04040 [Candidatus Nanoarchaeia archaeon]|nr:hypothetical protein [Candidatus Nanoarchaeia archaeon]
MGEVNSIYVPAAILHLNPGLTREEFVQELNKIHHDDGELDYHNSDWTCDTEFESHVFHHGLFELAQDILNLRRKDKNYFHIHCSCPDYPELVKLRKIYEERPEHIPNGPRFTVLARRAKNFGRWLAPYYEVKTVTGIEECEEKVCEGFFHFKKQALKPGVRFGHIDLPQGIWKVKEVHSAERIKFHGHKVLRAKVTAKRIKPTFRTELYPNLESLLKYHPEYNPESFDWSREMGILKGYMVGVPGWGWVKKNGRYYLDDAPPSYRGYCEKERDETHYTSIIITAEAIKAKAWGLFCYHGYEQTWRFLVDFPKAYERHQQAVFDWWMNKSAEGKLTNSEHLRRRIMFGSNAPRPKLDDQTALSIVLHDGLGRYRHIPGPKEDFEKQDKIPF